MVKAKKADRLKVIKKSAEAKVPPKPKVIQRLVAERNVDRYKAQGYKVASNVLGDKHDRVLGVKTNTSDLVLMEKTNK